MATIKYIEYDDETKQLAEILYNLLKKNDEIGDWLSNDVSWHDLNTAERGLLFAIIDDILEEADDLDYTYEDEDIGEWEDL